MDGDDEKMVACIRARMVLVGSAALESVIVLPPWRGYSGIMKEDWAVCWTSLGQERKEYFEDMKYIRIIFLGAVIEQMLMRKQRRCDLLATDPVHQRKGSARRLPNKLVDTADQEGVDMFLVSTDASRSVCKKASVTVREVILELTAMNDAKRVRERFTVGLMFLNVDLISVSSF